MLLLPRRRRLLAVAAAVAVALVGAAGVRYHAAPAPGRVDAALGAWLHLDAPVARDVASAVAVLGGVPATLVLVGALALLGARRHGTPGVLLAVAGPVLAALATELLLKPWVARTLEGDLAYPSGHATRIAAVATVLVVLTRRPGVAVAAGAAAAAVSTAMVALGHHYATDVVAGAAFGPATVVATALVLDRSVRAAASPRP